MYMTTQKTMWGKRLLMFSFFLGLTISLDLLVQMLQFDVRCIPLILRNVLHTHNMYFRPMENFLEVSEVQKIWKTQHFLQLFCYLQILFEVSIKLQKPPSCRVFIHKNVSVHVIGPEMFSTYFLEQGEHVTYPQHDIICHRSGSNAIAK